MSDPTATERDAIERLAESFVARFRAGERPSIEEFALRFPEVTDELRELLPALVLLEQHALPENPESFIAGAKQSASPRQIGDFTIVREIARGGMGVVYEAIQQSLGRHVALKVLSSPGLLNPTHLERFRLEARAAARLHHTHIVPVFDVGEHDGLHFYAMQFIPGQSLDLVIDELRRFRNASRAGIGPILTPSRAESSDGRSEIDDTRRVKCPGDESAAALNQTNLTASHSGDAFYRSVARVGLQVTEALIYAHNEGILHRDIKPSNLLLDVKGNVWVTDFGLAKADDTDGLTQTGDFVGTLRYMAPERLQGWSDRRSDIYSLGATLYELITLAPFLESPSRGQLVDRILHETPVTPSKFDRSIPRDLETIVLKATAKEPASRYRNGEAMAEDLRRFLADRPILARRSTAVEQLIRWRRRNPVVAALAGALALLLFSSVIVLAVSNSRIRSESAAKESARRDAEAARRDERSARQDAEARAEEIRQGHERLTSAIALVDQARIHRGEQHWDTAIDAYSDAIDSYPQFAPAWEERGDTYLRLGLVELAAHDINRSVELQPPQIGWQWFRHALLRAYVNDRSGYRHSCHQMLEASKSTHTTPSPKWAVEVVRAYVLEPNPDANLENLLQMAESAIARSSRYQWMLHVLGTAHYRAGRFEQAVRICTESLDSDPDWVSRSVNYPILAMAHHKLGHSTDSQTAMQQAMLAYERWTEQMLNVDGTWVINHGASEKQPIDPLDWLEFLIHLREARTFLGMEALDETRLVLRRARALAALRRASEAHAEFSRVSQLAPDNPLIQLEAQRNLAYYHAASERYAAGADAFAEAVQLAPKDAELWRFLAAANLAAGRDAVFLETCREMVERFGNSTDPAVASSVIEVCVCGATTVDDWHQLLSVAKIGSRHFHDSPRFLAATQFRAGQYIEAIETFRGVERMNSMRAFDFFFLAMTHDRLGHREEALRRLEQAHAWIEEANASETMPDVQVFTRADWGAWTERPLTIALQREAESLIAPSNPSTGP